MLPALFAALSSFLESTVIGLFRAFTDAREADRSRIDTDLTHERAAVSEAALETQKTIAEVADEQVQIIDNPDAANLVASLRKRGASPRNKSDPGKKQRRAGTQS